MSAVSMARKRRARRVLWTKPGDLAAMSYRELQALAKKYKIPAAGSRATLIEALTARLTGWWSVS